MHRPRPRTIAAGALILLLAAAPFIPRGEDDHGSIAPSSEQPRFQPRDSSAVGTTRITPEMRSEIERVADATAGVPQVHGRIDPRTAAAMAQCADLDGQRYCLGVGFTDEAPAAIQARVAADAAPARRTAHRRPRVNTGDLSARGEAKRLAAMTPAKRAAATRRELTRAARSVGKVWMLRHEIQGVPLPDDFLAAHPEARVSTTTPAARAAVTTAAATKSASPTPTTVKATTAAAPRTGTASPSATASATAAPTIAASVPVTYPVKKRILKRTQTAEQIRTYWCGPTSMQMITWGWKQKDRGAAHWASKLHTTTGGTAITDMVRVVNRSTGWDDAAHAGTYVVLDVRGWSTAQFYALMQKHIAQYRAPVILHPLLSTRYFPYLPYSGSGHYQVGRGYRTTADGVKEIGYFEPWNPQRFHPSVPYVSRVQWLPVSNVLAANKANSLHNIGL
ncbi:MAG: C39 family peptidase [Nocardioides sp.]